MYCSLIEHFDELPDPRVRGRTDYPLIEITFLCISAIISGLDGWEAIEDFGRAKLGWLRKFLVYKYFKPPFHPIAEHHLLALVPENQPAQEASLYEH